MALFRASMTLGMMTLCTASGAFESDVHYGLTQWLALKAGFSPEFAKIIAIGNNRIDSGEMRFEDIVLMYACADKDDAGARRAGEHHYPSVVPAPAPPEKRAVSAGDGGAREAAIRATKVAPDAAPYRLFDFGKALHVLQDSWSHAGVPDVPDPGKGLLACDPARAWSHPKARGGWNSHKADQTRYWHADTLEMARSTYDFLTQYPALAGVRRKPRAWEEIRPALDRFIGASTKSEKKQWFSIQGIDDVAFLEGTTLRDGAQPFAMVWPGRKLPPLSSLQSHQHGVRADLLDFYNRFFARWASATDFEAIATEFGSRPSSNNSKTGSAKVNANDKRELVARLKVWWIRDHGRVADIAHSLLPLSARELSALNVAAKEESAYARYKTPADAFFPLLPGGSDASPLLPFFVGTIPDTAAKNARAFAVAKFRHLPYDAVAVIAEEIDGHWRVISIVSAVDH